MPLAARVGVVVRVCPGRLAVRDVIAVLAGSEAPAGSAVPALAQDGSAVTVGSWGPAGWVERWVGLGQGESRSAVSRAGWLVSPAEWLLEDDIRVWSSGDGIRVD